MWFRKGKGEKPGGVAAVAAPVGPLPKTLENDVDGTELLLVPAGTFLRGSLPSQGDPDARPQREIYLDAFYVAKYPVTNKQYRKFLEKTGYGEPSFWKDTLFNQENQPVVGVSWHDSQEYCKWAGLRLPTEAEWEKAASWDDENKLKHWWPWGDVEPDPERANYARNIGHTTPVGQFALGVSPCSCYDMAGNAWEWCEDWYLYNYYEKSPEQNPKGPDRQRYKVLRGGSYRRTSEYIACTYRYWFTPEFKDNEVGFRCARTPGPSPASPQTG